MIDASDRAWIAREIARQVSIITHGAAADTNIDDVACTETIENCPPGNPKIEGRGVMFPYGLVSRAKKGEVAVIARVGEHPGNKLVLGHRPLDPPELGAAGEVALYDAFGNVVLLKDGKIVIKLDDKLELGEGATKEAARKGDSVDAGSILVVAPPSGGTCTVTYVAAGGTPVPGTTALSGGKITSGSGKVTIVD